jgi:hypothetical protein
VDSVYFHDFLHQRKTNSDAFDVIAAIDIAGKAGLNAAMLAMSVEQICRVFVIFLWSFLRESGTMLAVIWAAATAIYAVFLVRNVLRPKARPGIVNARITVDPGDLPSFRFFQGSFVATNTGGRHCELTAVRLGRENLNFDVTNVTDKDPEDIVGQQTGTGSDELPLSIMKNKATKIFFLGAHQIATIEKLPETLTLEVTFDCGKKPLACGMVHEPGTKKYSPAGS